MNGIKGAHKRTTKGGGTGASVFRRLITILAGLAVIASTFGLFAAPANAHTGDIEVTKEECVDATSMSATYEAGWSNGTATGKLYQRSGIHGQTGNAGSNVSGWTYVKDVSGASGSDTFTITHPKSTFTGANSENGPWWSSKIVFSNGYGVAADTRVEGFDWSKCDSPVIKECPETLGTVVVTPSNLQGFTFTETKATGHYEFLKSGLRIWTESNTSTDKVAGYKAVNVPLIDVGDPSLTFDNTSGGGIPGSQLVIDFDGNGTTDGILVGEAAYGDDWWLANSSAQFVKDGAPNTGGGSGSLWYGTLNEWLASYPDAVVKAFGFSLGSGVKGDGIINKITFNCTEYVFTTDPEVEPEQGTATATSEGCVEPGKSTGTVTITVYNTDDATNDDETYSVTFNNGDAATLVIPDGQNAQKIISNVAAGTYPVKVTGTDGTNLSLTVTVAECEEPPVVEPEGSNNSSSQACLQITVGTPTGVKPEGATVVVKLDGVVTQPGSFTTTAGSHVVTTFVNGELVDTDTVVVADCPVVTPPVVVPPVVTPPVVVPPVVTPPVVNPPAVKDNPSAKVNASCVTAHYGEGRAVLNNKRSNVKNTFRVVKTGRDKVVTVKAGAKKVLNLTGLRVGSVVKVVVEGKTLAKTKVPAGCEPTPVPDTGFRMVASKFKAAFRAAAGRLFGA